MSENKNSSLPMAIIGLVLIAAVAGGAWLYSRGPSKAPTTPAGNSTKKSDFAELYKTAPPGGEPTWSKGAANAPVVIEEFADFACPTCARVTPIVQEVRSSYGDRVKFIYRHFPLQIPAHKNAYDAARASEAAGLQGKFWEMENLLFKNQATWPPSNEPRKLFEEYAKQIGLDVDKFNADMLGMATSLKVDNDLKRGRYLQIQSTPSLILNGRLLSADDANAESLKRLIDGELAKAQGGNAPAAPANSSPPANTSAPANK